MSDKKIETADKRSVLPINCRQTTETTVEQHKSTEISFIGMGQKGQWLGNSWAD